MKILKIILFVFPAIVFFVSCSKEYSLEGGSVRLAGTWNFEQGGVPYNGNIDSSFIHGSGVTKILTITGKSLNGQEDFSIILYATDSFTLGTYKASLSESQFKYSTAAKTIFLADLLTGQFSVDIRSLSNNSIVGTFSGQVEDSAGNKVQVTLGTFVSTIDLSNNGTGQGSGVAVGTLSGSGGPCSPATLAGTFTQGIALTATNTVQLQVNITQPGTYTIATNSVNGINFFKTGTFTNTGVQNVTLNGAGTPQSAGVQNYTVTFGTNNCTFSVTFLPGSVPTGDYFPTTLNSGWVYGLQGGGATDSFAHKVISYAPSFAGQTFSTISEEFYPLNGTAQDSFYFRKSGGDYFEYEDVSLVLGFDGPVFGEVTFLKDNVQPGNTWQSQNFSGTVAGVPLTGFLKFTLLEKAVPETIGALNFPDIIKVKTESFLSIAPGIPFVTVESWYARGVGLIKSSLSAAGIAETYEIGQYQVL